MKSNGPPARRESRVDELRGVPQVLGVAHPRGYGTRPRLSPEAAAAFATYVDPARARAAMEGRTLVYTVRWN